MGIVSKMEFITPKMTLSLASTNHTMMKVTSSVLINSRHRSMPLLQVAIFIFTNPSLWSMSLTLLFLLMWNQLTWKQVTYFGLFDLFLFSGVTLFPLHTIPSTVKRLSTSHSFNIRLDLLPSSLTHLYLGHSFDCVINKLPSSLISLTFSPNCTLITQ